MDDIARHLGMSKKTIYAHFQDKNELVYTLIKNRMHNQACMMENDAKDAENAIHEFFLAVTQMQKSLSNLNPMLFYDMQKYHPEAWMEFKAFKEKGLYKTVYQNLERGIKEEIYRSDIDLEILTRLRVDQVDLVFNQSISHGSKFSVLQIMIAFTEHFLYGVCNLQGHKIINKYKNIID